MRAEQGAHERALITLCVKMLFNNVILNRESVVIITTKALAAATTTVVRYDRI